MREGVGRFGFPSASPVDGVVLPRARPPRALAMPRECGRRRRLRGATVGTLDLLCWSSRRSSTCRTTLSPGSHGFLLLCLVTSGVPSPISGVAERGDTLSAEVRDQHGRNRLCLLFARDGVEASRGPSWAEVPRLTMTTDRTPLRDGTLGTSDRRGRAVRQRGRASSSGAVVQVGLGRTLRVDGGRSGDSDLRVAPTRLRACRSVRRGEVAVTTTTVLLVKILVT